MRRLIAFGIVAVGAMTLVTQAHAVPSFTRQTGMTCAQCHVMFGAPVPNFTFTGKKFRMNGYRVPFVTERIEAGQEGSLGGKRLNISLFPYLSLRYQSVFATQTKAPGAAKAAAITSNPTSRVSFFTGGPVGDNFGLWTEMSVTPDGSAQNNEWTMGLFSLNEYDLRYTRMRKNGVYGLSFSNQGIAELAGFGPWSPGGSQLNRGGITDWSHPNRGQLAGYAWLRNQIFVSLGASPGESNLDWRRMNYLGQAAYALRNSDAHEVWVNVMWKAGNDAIPLATIATPAANRSWTYTTSEVAGVPAVNPAQMQKFSRITTEARYGFIDHGPNSLEAGASFNLNKDDYTTGAHLKQNSIFGRLRYVRNRTYGADISLGKPVTYEYTNPGGVTTKVPTKVGYNTYWTFQPAMNIILALQYGNTQALTLGAASVSGWNWGLNIDFLF